MLEIDINDSSYELHNKPEINKRTKERLAQLVEMGMEETGIATFGKRGVVGGFYIERVWSKSDNEWTEYMEWAQSVIDKNK